MAIEVLSSEKSLKRLIRPHEEQIKVLERQIQDLKDRWPAHSVPPAMLQRLDELEEELESLKR